MSLRRDALSQLYPPSHSAEHWSFASQADDQAMNCPKTFPLASPLVLVLREAPSLVTLRDFYRKPSSFYDWCYRNRDHRPRQALYPELQRPLQRAVVVPWRLLLMERWALKRALALSTGARPDRQQIPPDGRPEARQA